MARTHTLQYTTLHPLHYKRTRTTEQQNTREHEIPIPNYEWRLDSRVLRLLSSLVFSSLLLSSRSACPVVEVSRGAARRGTACFLCAQSGATRRDAERRDHTASEAASAGPAGRGGRSGRSVSESTNANSNYRDRCGAGGSALY